MEFILTQQGFIFCFMVIIVAVLFRNKNKMQKFNHIYLSSLNLEEKGVKCCAEKKTGLFLCQASLPVRNAEISKS